MNNIEYKIKFYGMLGKHGIKIVAIPVFISFTFGYFKYMGLAVIFMSLALVSAAFLRDSAKLIVLAEAVDKEREIKKSV